MTVSSRGKWHSQKKCRHVLTLIERSTSTAVLPCQDQRELSVHHKEGWTETVTSSNAAGKLTLRASASHQGTTDLGRVDRLETKA